MIDRNILREIKEDLADIRSNSQQQDPSAAAERLERASLQLITAAGGEAVSIDRDDEPVDFAAWIPGTEKFLSSPLLIEVKLLRRPEVARGSIDRLRAAANSRGATWALLLYFSITDAGGVKIRGGASWPYIMALNIEELATRLQDEGLAQILNNERNAIMHGASGQ
ncbi:hypothetical protein GCM10010109_20950 [Actinoplanes campanulatus]|nr:hypothetical protein GCM10010109_20950 [Actinoplanes campanulatus]GID36611.1 hypothetical protein Aca09nite_31170 [Actinoplanes campanulatus]